MLQTPLKGADGQVYAVAQGPVSIGGLTAGNAGGNVQVNHPTVGMVSNGALIEREITTDALEKDSIDLLLRSPNNLTAVKMADAINEFYPGSSLAQDGGVVNVRVPADFLGQSTNFITAAIFLDLSALSARIPRFSSAFKIPSSVYSIRESPCPLSTVTIPYTKR